jgi:Ca2+-binding EF-hand superfamily protein
MAKFSIVAFILLLMLIVGHIHQQIKGQAQQENSKEPQKEKAQDQAQRLMLPPGFKALDTDGDGQVSLSEWRAAGRPLEEFWEYDLDQDGLITSRELKRVLAERSQK